MREKKCKFSECGETFKPFTSLQQVCSGSIKCAVGFAKEKERKKFKTDTREMKKELLQKDRKYQLVLAQNAFNAFIRERDRGYPCIDCGCYEAAQWQAGHYKTRGGFPELRFEESNVFKQCSQCNKNGLRGTVEFRRNLVERIGIARVEWLEGPHEPKNYSIDDIIAIKNKYKLKLKRLTARGLVG